MRRWSLPLFTVLFSVVAHAEEPRPRLALLPITGDGVLVDDLAPVEEALRRELTKGGRFKVIDRERTVAELKGARSLGLHCAAFEVACLVRLGLVGEMDLLLVPAATREGRFLFVTLSLIDVKREREVSRVARVMDPRAIDEGAGRLLRELLALEPGRGMLALKVSPDGARVLVDGTERGTTPLRAPIGGLSAGEHSLVVEKAGYRPAHATVLVRELDISLYDLRLAALDDDERESAAALVETSRERGEPGPRIPSEAPRAERTTLGGAAIAGAAGAALALGGGLGAFALFGLEEQSGATDDQRQGMRTGGQALLVVAAAGALLAVGSAAYLGVSLMRTAQE